MRRLSLVTLLTFAVLWVIPLSFAKACVIHIVELDNVLDAISGEPVAEMGDARIVGVVEMRVLKTWPATDTHRAASAAAPSVVWGETSEVPTRIHGGQLLVPDTTTDCPQTE